MQDGIHEKITDHKRIGQIQDLFLISQEIGSGFPIFAPKGLIVRREIERFITDEKEKRGYMFVWTPHVAKSDLYKKSGHWQKYDAMFNPMKLDDEEYVLKPMNCPHHFQIFLNRPRSYRELPMRLSENATVYRYEKSGEVNGLLRVRGLTIDDTHTFLRYNQIPEELENVLGLMKFIFRTFGFTDYKARISVRDPKDKKKYIGDDEHWEMAEKALVDAVKKQDIKYSIGEDEAAFYGPKIDMMVSDSLGREWQLATCQLDFNQPNNFDMNYTNEEGKDERPAILHTAFLGSVERFMGILIEHYAGKFPVWIAPVQARVLPITDKVKDYADKVAKELKESGIRVEVDERNETLQAKIRNAQEQEIPFMLVVGEREEKDGSLSVRKRDQKESATMSIKDFIASLSREIDEKTIS
ncbi:MAG TPA: threonine--tRNA ligase [Patescibacteria group bacterium]|nr:threonine--tRNA ligase [Patescibacteria group bacterium]